MRFLFFLLMNLFFISCSSHFGISSNDPSVYKTGNDTQSITIEAGNDIVDLDRVRSEAYTKAQNVCQSINKTFTLVHEDMNQPPFHAGNNISITVIFKCD